MQKQTQTKIGHIGFEDHRFRGRSVLTDLIDKNDMLSLIWLGLTGHDLTTDDRKLLDFMAGAAAAADPRVWPLKIARLLSSYGNAFAGYFGAQLAVPSDRIGAGSLNQCTTALTAMLSSVQATSSEITSHTVRPVLAAYLEKNKILNGFGVPFRKRDERLDALLARIQGLPGTERPYFKLAMVLMDEMRTLKNVEPNVSVAIGALLLDMGIPASQTPFVCSLLVMTPAFAPHAVEAAEPGFRHWTRLEPHQIDYKGKAKRSL